MNNNELITLSNENLSALLRDSRNACHLSIDEVASLLNKRGITVSQKTLYGYENGVSAPKIPTFLALCDIYEISDIMSALGLTIADDVNNKNTATILGSGIKNIQPMPATRRVPRLGTIACGEPILAVQNLDGYDEVPDYFKCDFTLICKGDSMTGARIYDGDIVCIRQQPTVENGEIAAVLINDEATLKRVQFDSDMITLWPENPSFKPLVYMNEQMNEVKIIGKATHFISFVR